MSIDQEKHLISNKHDNQAEGQFLPPRAAKHGRRRPESEVEEQKADVKSKSFPFIQIMMWTLLSIILCMIVFGLWQQKKESLKLVEPQVKEDVRDLDDEDADEVDHTSSNTTSNSNSEVSTEETDNSANDYDAASEDKNAVTPTQPNASAEPNQSTETPDEEKSHSSAESQPKVISEHIVQTGETFYSITMKYYKSREYEDFLALHNGISDKSNIKAGMKIKIFEVKQ